jgi:AcrR family transcriptional regulator
MRAMTAAAPRGRSVHLGDREIPGGHVCALVDGPDDFFGQLTGFVADGLDQGERAIHVVDPASRDRHLERLAQGGIDVAAALDTGQLEVRTWADAYLIHGSFQPARTADVVIGLIAEGRDRGYPATRLIGVMEWVLEQAPGVEAIGSYEALLEARLRPSPDVIVCAYDVRRQRPSLIVDMLAMHPYALVEDRLRTGTPRPPRDRILVTAARLFHRHGVAATGVDRVIAEAGVAKATFYRQYRTKEDLVLAWIRDPATRWFDRILEQAERATPSPDAVLLAIFDGTASWLERNQFRGCPYLNTIAELADVQAEHRVRAAALAYLEEIGAHLRRLATRAGVDPGIGDQVHTLLAGAIELAVARRSTAPLLVARAATESLVASAA